MPVVARSFCFGIQGESYGGRMWRAKGMKRRSCPLDDMRGVIGLGFPGFGGYAFVGFVIWILLRLGGRREYITEMKS
jgi:hypothetical protein